MGTGGSFVRGSGGGVKWLRHEADHSPPSSAEVKDVWSYTHIPHNTSSWYGA